MSKKQNLQHDLFDNILHEEELIEYDDLSSALSKQVTEILGNDLGYKKKKKKKYKVVFILTGAILFSLAACLIILIRTKSGRKILYKLASNYIYEAVDKDKGNVDIDNNINLTIKTIDFDVDTMKNNYKYRHEDYVTNYLIFGIEEIKGAKNTDSMMIVSINTKDRSIKVTSILRDIYIESKEPKKLNAFYAEGGAEKLIDVIEETFKIHIDGYASVNFEAFEKVIDRLGGITIELGKEEAKYLNTTNYISNPAYRNVKPGINHLNGNQVLGYCRIRRVKTLGGANDDYGRTLRQRRVLKAIFDKYKSENILTLMSIMKECLNYVTSNLEKNQIEYILETVIENKITKMDDFRIPVNGYFQAPKKYNGIKYPLVLDLDKNIIELYKFIYLDTESEAEEVLKLYK